MTWVFGPIKVELGAICDFTRGNGLQKKDFVNEGYLPSLKKATPFNAAEIAHQALGFIGFSYRIEDKFIYFIIMTLRCQHLCVNISL